MGNAVKVILFIVVAAIGLILLGATSLAQNFVYRPTPVQPNYSPPPMMGPWMMRGDPNYNPNNNQNPPTYNYYNDGCW